MKRNLTQQLSVVVVEKENLEPKSLKKYFCKIICQTGPRLKIAFRSKCRSKSGTESLMTVIFPIFSLPRPFLIQQQPCNFKFLVNDTISWQKSLPHTISPSPHSRFQNTHACTHGHTLTHMGTHLHTHGHTPTRTDTHSHTWAHTHSHKDGHTQCLSLMSVYQFKTHSTSQHYIFC